MHVPLLWLGRLFGWEMHILQKAGSSGIVERFLQQGWLNWVYVYNPRPVTSLAVRLAEQRFGGLQSDMARMLNSVASPEDIECIRLRQAVDGVFASSFLHYRACLFAGPADVGRVFVVTADSELWPHVAYADFALPSEVTEKVRKIGSLGLVRMEKRISAILLSFRFALTNSLRVLAAGIGSRPAPATRHFKCALKFNNPWHLKFKGARRHDFLVDGKLIRHEDIVYLFSFVPSSAEVARLGSANTVVLRDRLRIRSFLGLGWRMSEVVRLLGILIRTPFMRDAEKFFHGVQALFSGHLLLRSLEPEFKIDNFVYCNDESVDRIGANAVLRRNGVRTWCYPIAIGGPYLYDVEGSHWDTINPMWCYLNPDVWLAYNEAMSQCFAKQHQRVGQYMVIGNMFGALIDRTNGKDLGRIIDEARSEKQTDGKTVAEGSRLVAVFDTSYVDSEDVYSPVTSGIEFLKDLRAIARENPDIHFVFKPSKPRHVFRTNWRSTFSTVNTLEYGKILDQLVEMANWTELKDEIDPPDLIGLADLVITAPFSSPTADAISRGIPAIWYEAENRPRAYFYERMRGFVVMGRQALGDGIMDWKLTGVLPVAWRCRPQDVADTIDPFLDGGALSRFRAMLAGGAEADNHEGEDSPIRRVSL